MIKAFKMICARKNLSYIRNIVFFVCFLIFSLCLSFNQSQAAEGPTCGKKKDGFGIHAMYQAPFNASYVRDVKSLLSLNYVTGLSLYIPWNLVEPRAGYFDWSYIDNALSIAATKKKTISLALEVSSFAPDWVKEKSVTFSYIHPNHNIGQQIAPVPWNPYYQRQLSDMIYAMSKRYNGNPHLLFVVIDGPATLWGTETNWMMKPHSLSKSDQEKLNFSYSKYIAGWELMIDEFFRAFPDTSLALALNNQIDMPGSAETKLRSIQTIRDYALAVQKKYKPGQKLWLELLGLTDGVNSPAQFTTENISGIAETPYVKLVWEEHGKVKIDYQASYVFRLHRPTYSAKDVDKAMLIGASYGADIIEVKSWDLINMKTGQPYKPYAKEFIAATKRLFQKNLPCSDNLAP